MNILYQENVLIASMTLKPCKDERFGIRHMVRHVVACFRYAT